MTDEVRAQAKTEHPSSGLLLNLIVESAVDFAIFAMDEDGRVTSWNRGAERLLGYPETEIIGADADVVFTPEDRRDGIPAQERSDARAFGRAEDERWHLRKDGSRFWGSGIAMPLANATGYVKILRDLTERRLAQERLRESEELFRVLATNIPQLVFRSRVTGERTWGSPQWIVFTGLTFEESIGFGWLDAVHPDEHAITMEAWRKARETREYYAEHRIRRAPDSEYRWHQTRAKPIEKDEDDWVGTSTDVHEMRGLQDRQSILVAELQHRTRNLIAVVQSVARQTMRGSRTLDEFAGLFEGRLRALSRIQGLLARTDRGSVDLRHLVELEVEAHGFAGLGSGRVTIDGPDVILPAATAQTLALAVHELATNAVKYGGLKQASGRLDIVWEVTPDHGSDPRLVLDWRESGVDMSGLEGRPPRKGYGSELIERALPYQLGAETRLQFGPDGVRCRIETAIGREELGRV